MTQKFKTDVVFFLQSLGEIDDPTGINVRDYLSQSSFLPHEKFLSFQTFGESDFKAALLWILLALERKEYSYPAIQIDCHGSREGLSLRSGEVITWDRVRDFLNQILERTDENLLIISGACHGKFLFYENEPMNYIPCSVLVASRAEVASTTLADRFGMLYCSLFEKGNLNEAVNEMNEGYNQDGHFEIIIP